MKSVSELNITNPKLRSRSVVGRAKWYPYYAGFSGTFIHALVSSIGEGKMIRILDPWNGSGTTTSIGASLGHTVYGCDLNPVMVVIAKARMMSRRDTPSLLPIMADIVNKARNDQLAVTEDDPLCLWFGVRNAEAVRRIDKSIQGLLVDEKFYSPLVVRGTNCLSDIAAFFYTALFRTVRVLLRGFFSSNPTWTKRPRNTEERVSVAPEAVLDIFNKEIQRMMAHMDDEPFDNGYSEADAVVETASSEQLPLNDKAIDSVISSPPYCTRIDYAVATMVELAVMGYTRTGSFDSLRRKLIGTSTVPKDSPSASTEWGATCSAFLDRVQNHRSKASKTYYHKNLVQYFSSIDKSLSEIRRVLMPGGLCILVVQDSYYKDVHIDLPRIFTEMAEAKKLNLGRKVDFGLERTMAGINPAVRQYRGTVSAVESVLCLANE